MVVVSFDLRPQDELRIEVTPHSAVSLRLVSGSAEIFGYDLALSHWIKFPPDHKFAVFTWSGATIEINGRTDVAYVANETPMSSYKDVHLMLEKKYAEGFSGPRVIVVGPTDSGKSSISKTLLGWAVRQNRKPTFVDLDLGQNSLTIPGAIAATIVSKPVDPVECIPLTDHLVYFYGHVTPSVDQRLYRSLVKDLAVRLDGNTETRVSGMVINTMGWVEDLGYDLLLHAIENFNVDLVLVVGDGKLQNSLCNDLRARPEINIAYVERSKGIVPRSRECRRCTRNSKMKEYFYGLFGELSPPLNSVHLDELHVFTINSSKKSRKRGEEKVEVVPINIGQDYIGSVLAVSHAKQPNQLISSCVLGFIYVTDIDLRRKRMTYITPGPPGPLPSNVLLKGSLFWTP